MRLVTIAVLLLSAAACSSDRGMTKDGSFLEGDDGAGLFRIDVHPAAEDSFDADGAITYLTQSVLTSASSEEDVDIIMKEAVHISGMVTGWEVTPMLSPNLPGSYIPISASVAISKPDSVQSYFFSSDENGYFEGSIVPEPDYSMTITPHTTGSVFSTMDLEATEGADLVFDVILDYGQTLWGQVVGPEGAGMEDVGVFAEDLGGHRGQTTYTNSNGYFTLRVEPGQYHLNTLGRTAEAGRDPALRAAVTVEDGVDKRYDFAYQRLASHSIGGRVVNTAGGGFEGVAVQFVSKTLDGFDNPSVETAANVTVLTNTYGNFDTRLAPGEYEMLVLPPNEVSATGLSLEQLVVTGEMSLGQIALEDMVEVTGLIQDPLSVLPGSRIQCDEQAPGVRYWTAVASEQSLSLGQYSLELPQSPVTCAISPPGGRPELAITRVSFTPEQGIRKDITLSTGTEIYGVVTQSDDTPFIYALVQVYSLTGDLLGTTITNSEGGYSVSIDIENL